MYDNNITPAHLLVLPTDNKNLINFFSLTELGRDSLRESSAFKKLQTISKTPHDSFNLLINNLNSRTKNLVGNISNIERFANSTNYRLERQHTVLAKKALGSSKVHNLDLTSFKKFLGIRSGLKVQNSYTLFNNLNIMHQLQPLNFKTSLTLLPNYSFSKNSFGIKDNLNLYFPKLSFFNNDTDKKYLSYPLRKNFNKLFFKDKLNLLQQFKTQRLENFFTLKNFNFSTKVFNSNSTHLKNLTYQSTNQGFLAADQNLRQYKGVNTNIANYNFLNPNLD